MKKISVSDIPSLTSEEKLAIIKLKERIDKEFKLVKLILLGSKARGDHNIQSDVDLLC